MSALVLPVFSCSLDPRSKSRELAVTSVALLREAGHHTELVDLAATGLPTFDNDRVFDTALFARLHETIRAADGIVLSFPIYNWAPGATVKWLIESTGATGDGEHTAAWFDKVVTFVCAAGLPHSYMATTSIGQSLMADFKCIINPYVGYVSGRDWVDDQLSDDRGYRLEKTLRVHVELAQLLRPRSYSSDWEV